MERLLSNTLIPLSIRLSHQERNEIRICQVFIPSQDGILMSISDSGLFSSNRTKLVSVASIAGIYDRFYTFRIKHGTEL